ncbi:MAG: MopE-related protein [Candidatus Nanoarchaeia archaeon]|nr:MopE-related protein [Candidatus Nanoarchaeia archaeon]
MQCKMKKINFIFIGVLIGLMLVTFIYGVPTYQDDDSSDGIPDTVPTYPAAESCTDDIDCFRSKTCCSGVCCGVGKICSGGECVNPSIGGVDIWEGSGVPEASTKFYILGENECAFTYTHKYEDRSLSRGVTVTIDRWGIKVGSLQFDNFGQDSPLLVCNKVSGTTIDEICKINKDNFDICFKEEITKGKKECENLNESCLDAFKTKFKEKFNSLKSEVKLINLKSEDIYSADIRLNPNPFNYFYGNIFNSRITMDAGVYNNVEVIPQFNFKDLSDAGYLFDLEIINSDYDRSSFRYGCYDLLLNLSNGYWSYNFANCNSALKPLNFKLQNSDQFIAGVIDGSCIYLVSSAGKEYCGQSSSGKSGISSEATTCECKSKYNGDNIITGTGSCFDSLDNDADGKTDLIDGKEDLSCKCALASFNGDKTIKDKSNENLISWFGKKNISEFNKPACSDGKDNDEDGLVDKNDPGCLGIKEGVTLGCAGKTIGQKYSISDIIDTNNYFSCDTDESDPVLWYLLPGRCALSGYKDEDRDGECSNIDCDDSNALVKKGSRDVCGNGIDEDCSGSDCTAECKYNDIKKCETACTNCQGVWTRLPDSMYPHIEGGVTGYDNSIYAIAGRTNLGNRLWGAGGYCWNAAWGTGPKDVTQLFNLVVNLEGLNLNTSVWETYNEPEKRWLAPNPDYTNWLYLQYDPSNVGGGANAEETKALVGNTFETVNDWTYLIGGYGLPAVNAHTLSVIYSFNPISSWWARVAQIGVDCSKSNCGKAYNYGQSNRMYHSSVVVGDKIYIFGGVPNAMVGSETDFSYYDELKAAGAMSDIVSWKSDLFVVDTLKITYYPEKPYSMKLQTLSSNGGRYQLKSASNPRKSAGMFSYNNKIYLIGGRVFNADGRTYSKDQKLFQVYDIVSNSWSNLPDSIYEHGLNPGVIVKDNLAYVVGGSTVSSPRGTTNVEYYNLTEGKWYSVKTINQPEFLIGGGTSTVVNGKLYYLSTIGGGSTIYSNDGKSSVLVFDPSAKAENITNLYQRCSAFNTYENSPCYETTLTTASTCVSGNTKVCGVGVCSNLSQTCVNGAWGGCVYNSSISYESNETSCDNLDNDCDSSVDENCDCDEEGDERDCDLQDGVCEDSTQECNEDLEWEECDYGDDYEDEEESCSDELDNDCDGDTDSEDDDCDEDSSADDDECSDGTSLGECSGSKPLKCISGILTYKCSDCGCPSGKTCKSDNTCGTKTTTSEDWSTEDEEVVEEETTERVVSQKETSGFPWIILVLFLLILIGIFVYFFYIKKKLKTTKKTAMDPKIAKLVNYIKAARAKKTNDKKIRENLLKVGWIQRDIDEAFRKSKKNIFDFFKIRLKK